MGEGGGGGTGEARGWAFGGKRETRRVTPGDVGVEMMEGRQWGKQVQGRERDGRRDGTSGPRQTHGGLEKTEEGVASLDERYSTYDGVGAIERISQ
eukprot:scaffold163553_cov29-Tisochrysis_lutea.AAC.2